jgi:3-keto-L-gulonate-6-phosphate decarboxylase
VKIIDQYKTEIEKDLQVDMFNIKDVSMRTPGRKHYWVCKLIQHKKNLLNLKGQRWSLKREIVKLIQQESPVKVTAPVAEKTAYQHEKMIELQQRIDEQELIVDFLEKTEKTFTSLSFDIKNIIEIMKMEQL